MGELINVKELVSIRKEELRKEVEKLNESKIKPTLAVIIASKDEASKVYVSRKRKMCKELGINEEEYSFDETVKTEEILDLIGSLNNNPDIHGILVQLPLFDHLNENIILESIYPKKDVDGFHPYNLGKLFVGEETLISCTPKGIMTILDSINTEFAGKNAVVVGRSRIVGKPVSQLLLARGATVTICHSKTVDLWKYTKEADILIAAVGRPHIIKADMIKKGATVIDVGINRVDGKIIGDVDTDNSVQVCSKITPVPGGVGLTTVLSLMENVVQASKKM